MVESFHSNFVANVNLQYPVPYCLNTENRASDHRLVFADLNLTPLPEVEIVLDEAVVHEEGEAIAGRVQLTQALGEDLTGRLVLASADIGEIETPTWTISAGSLMSSDLLLLGICFLRGIARIAWGA
jgi:hypothetical protein